MAYRIDPLGIERFCEELERLSGLAYTPAKAYLFESRLLPLVRSLGVSSYQDLSNRILKDPDLCQQVIEALVTSETFFFRDEATFRALPAMASRAGKGADPLVTWSVGCATGQEAYSILFGLSEAGWDMQRVRMVGLDVSQEALSRARAARYTAFECQRGMPQNLLERYLAPAGGSYREVREPWRSIPEWTAVNLVNGLPRDLPRPHLVFCRNILVYFRDAVRKRLLEELADLLAPGGLLVLGNTENALIASERLVVVPSLALSIYERRSAVPTRAPV